MMIRTHRPEITAQDTLRVLGKSRLPPRHFATLGPENESFYSEARFSHKLGYIDLFPRPIIQSKLRLGPVAGKYEQEADQVADAVMRMRDPRPNFHTEEEFFQAKPIADQITPLIQRELPELEEEEEIIQPKKACRQISQLDSDLETQIRSIRSSGQPLPEFVRNFFESRFGYDFGSVRIHADSKAFKAAKAVKAQAFTIGKDIVFDTGKYDPRTATGKRLLAHELVHVVHQSDGNSKIVRREVRNGGDSSEDSIEDLTAKELSLIREWIARGSTGFYDLTGDREHNIDVITNDIYCIKTNDSVCIAQDIARRPGWSLLRDKIETEYENGPQIGKTVIVRYGGLGFPVFKKEADKFKAHYSNAIIVVAKTLREAIDNINSVTPNCTGCISNLAIFSHGTENSLELNGGSINLRNLSRFVDGIKAKLSPFIRVILYACRTGSEDTGINQQTRQRNPPIYGGPGSFAGCLRDKLVSRNFIPEVWAHTIEGHTTFNPFLVTFGPMTGSTGQFFYDRVFDARFINIECNRFNINCNNQSAKDEFLEKLKYWYLRHSGSQWGRVIAMRAPVEPETVKIELRRLYYAVVHQYGDLDHTVDNPSFGGVFPDSYVTRERNYLSQQSQNGNVSRMDVLVSMWHFYLRCIEENYPPPNSIRVRWEANRSIYY